MLHYVACLEVAGVCGIIGLRDEWRFHRLHCGPIDIGEEWHLLHLLGRWPLLGIHGEELFDGLDGRIGQCLLAVGVLDIWRKIEY